MKKSRPKVKSLKSKTVLLILTGSIAAYKSGDLIQALRDRGARVICVMTESAKKFITPLTIRSISGSEVYHDFFASDTPFDVLHTSLAEQADVVLAAPASANFIARLAAGMAGDLASCIVLATQKPVVIAPAMNDQMYRHPLTQANMKTLRGIGYHFIEPIKGHLVCGKEAIGHISDTDTMVDRLSRLLQNPKRK